MPESRPYSREQYNRALILNALFSPFNIGILALMLIAGIVLGVFAPVAIVAVLVYGGACARTYFDQDAANKVLESEKGKRKPALKGPRLDLNTLAVPIRNLVLEARRRRDTVVQAIQTAQLPFEEVGGEIDAFVVAIEGTAQRAQLLYSALADTPPPNVKKRLKEVQAYHDPSYASLEEALTTQLQTLEKMEKQLRRFYAEMERTLVELDTIRSQLVSASASTDASKQREIASDVRALREQVGAVADGLNEAYSTDM